MAICLPKADDVTKLRFKVPKPCGCSNGNLQPLAALSAALLQSALACASLNGILPISSAR